MSEETKPFEDILGELEEHVERLERGELSLEEALAAFEQGMNLAKQGSEILEAAEKKVEVLISNRDGVLETRPLDAGTESDE